MRIALLTDAWAPQVNGVVTALTALVAELEAAGHDVLVIHPGLFVTVPCPTYREIRLAAAPLPGVARRMQRFQPDAVHIATEGSVGLAGWLYCLLRHWHFTTAFHTRFPEYLNARWSFLSVSLGYRVLSQFHRQAVRTLVSTPPLADFLEDHGFSGLALWPRGVDTALFRPIAPAPLGLTGPVFTYFGRVAPEKNIEAFLSLELPGSKLVIGDGPARRRLQKRYPQVCFVGMRLGEDLVAHLCAADCMVFPSRTDTLGLVLMEAMACGLPVAAFPVTGPRQVVQNGITGVLDDDLRAAALAALSLDPVNGIAYAKTNGWAASAAEFVAQLTPARRQGLYFPATTRDARS